MGKVLTVKFVCTQDAEDLYKNVETGRIYARQPANVDSIVFWLSTVKMRNGGYEADCPIKAGITMRAVDPNGNVMFEETLKEDTWNSGTSAEKVGPFFREAVRDVSRHLRNVGGFHTYEEWSAWLLAEAPKYGYTGYSDNWRFWETDVIVSRIIGTAKILGETYPVIMRALKHKICRKEWTETLIMDHSQVDCLDIVGYKWEE